MPINIPTLSTFDSNQEGWFFTLAGHQSRMTIERNTGRLTCTPPLYDLDYLPNAHTWDLELKYLKTPVQGWVLSIAYKNGPGIKKQDFGFFSAQSKHAAGELHERVTRIKKRMAHVKRTLPPEPR
jgi:hypothetical protein